MNIGTSSYILGTIDSLTLCKQYIFIYSSELFKIIKQSQSKNDNVKQVTIFHCFPS